MDLSGGLLIRKGYERSEADVKHELISPLLKRVAPSMSSILFHMEWNGEAEYASSLIVESSTERRIHRPGAKPSVDYCLVGRTEGEILYKVAVEVKMTTWANWPIIWAHWGRWGAAIWGLVSSWTKPE